MKKAIFLGLLSFMMTLGISLGHAAVQGDEVNVGVRVVKLSPNGAVLKDKLFFMKFSRGEFPMDMLALVGKVAHHMMENDIRAPGGGAIDNANSFVASFNDNNGKVLLRQLSYLGGRQLQGEVTLRDIESLEGRHYLIIQMGQRPGENR